MIFNKGSISTRGSKRERECLTFSLSLFYCESGGADSLHKYEIYSEDEADGGSEMIPVELLALEEHIGDDAEDCEGEYFLYNLELHKGEGATVANETDAVGGYHNAILEEGDAPGRQYYQNERPPVVDVQFRQFQLSVPGEGHEDVGYNQKKYSPESLHVIEIWVRI